LLSSTGGTERTTWTGSSTCTQEPAMSGYDSKKRIRNTYLPESIE
jgi:hypothetical protein